MIKKNSSSITQYAQKVSLFSRIHGLFCTLYSDANNHIYIIFFSQGAHRQKHQEPSHHSVEHCTTNKVYKEIHSIITFKDLVTVT